MKTQLCQRRRIIFPKQKGGRRNAEYFRSLILLLIGTMDRANKYQNGKNDKLPLILTLRNSWQQWDQKVFVD